MRYLKQTTITLLKKRFKYIGLSMLMFFVLFILIRLLLDSLFPEWNGAYKAMFTGAMTAILAPRISKSPASQYQLVWIFLKKPIPVSF